MNKETKRSVDHVCVPNLLEHAEAEYLFDRVSTLTRLPENPFEAEVFETPPYRGFLVGANDSPMNNRICGFDLQHGAFPSEEIARFTKAGAPVHLPVIGAPKDVKQKASSFGAAPLRGWTHGQFYAELGNLPIDKASESARRLDISEMRVFAEIHSAAFRSSGARANMTLDMFRGLMETERAQAYAIDFDGRPAAIGLVYFASNQTAYLATAATTRAARKKGAHTALIARRIEAAREHGAVRISSTALLNSQSRRNLERAGLSLSHVQTLLALSSLP